MNDSKILSQKTLDTYDVEKNTNTIVSNLNKIQEEINANIIAMNALKDTIIAYQTSLSSSDNLALPWLDKIEQLLNTINTLEDFTNKLKNVGRGKMFPLTHCCFEYADINMCSLGY